MTHIRIALISCSARKAEAPCPARELYQGDLFKASVAWVQRRPQHIQAWGILSAQHGLVMPDQELAPYDRTLASAPENVRRSWGERTAAQIANRWGMAPRFVLLAGRTYTEFLQVPASLGVRRQLRTESVFDQWRELHQLQGGGRWGIGEIKRALAEDRKFIFADMPCPPELVREFGGAR